MFSRGLLGYAALLPLEDFNFNWFYIVKHIKNHKYDFDSQTKQIKDNTVKIPWTEKLGRLQAMGSQRVRYDLATKPPSYQGYINKKSIY